MIIPQAEIYQTKDLGIAALLYSKGVRLVECIQSERVIWFQFGSSANCELLARAFWRKEASVDAKTYFDSLRTLKTMVKQIHENK